MLKRPMKAPGEGGTLDQLKAMRYPLACSPKLDGIRGCKTYDGMMSSSLKMLGNQFMQHEMDDQAFNGLDGELIVGLPHTDPDITDDDVFNRSSGPIRRKAGEPDFKFYVFDDFNIKDISYNRRWVSRMNDELIFNHPRIVVLEQRICENWQEAMTFEEELVTQGYEGMMARTLSAHYKEGRVTFNEGYIIKRKPLGQSEGRIIGYFEQMENLNEQTTSALGTSVRSSHKDNKKGKGILGGFIVSDPLWKGELFRCGTIKGATLAWRKEMYDNPDLFMDKILTYTYQKYGSIDKPRIPVGKVAFRDPDDMTLF